MSRLAARRPADVHLRSRPQFLEYEHIVARLARDRPERILDWGCGLGQVAQMMIDAGLGVEAFDYRPEIPEDGVYPLHRYPDVKAYLSSDPVTLPYADHSFDAVLSCGVLEHVGDPDRSLDEIRRVLEPGGTFYVYKLPNRYSYLELIARRAGLIHHGALPDDRLYTTRSAAALMRAHGYEIGELRRANMLPLTLRGPLATRAAGAIWRVNRALSRVPVLNLVATNVELVATAPR